uniref:Uncharacterized protein n=1 Tax=Leersia perrieri TaxID=77586 RepID=A0A0D9XUK9_9ORYZ
MASSPPEKGKELPPPAAAEAAGEGSKKTVTVRMSQSQIDLFMSFNVQPDQEEEEDEADDPQMKEIDAVIAKFEKELLEESRMVKEQYQQKGYVEYEADATLFKSQAPPRARRRRARRHGVIKKKP